MGTASEDSALHIHKNAHQQSSSIKGREAYLSPEDQPKDHREIDLWQAFKGGSEEAFIAIYRRYFQLLYAYGHQFTKDTNLVEDCIQELFIELRARRERLKDTNSIKFYLFKALRNRILRQLSRKKMLPFNEELMDGYNFEINLSHEHKMIHAQLDREVKQTLNDVVNRLTIRQREIILYYFYEKLSYAEIADIMNLSKPKFARDLLYRAIASIKVEMKNSNIDLFTLLLSLSPFMKI